MLRLSGPDWITLSGTTLTVAAPSNLHANQRASVELVLAFSDGRTLSDFRPLLNLVDKSVYTPGPTITNDVNLGSASNGYGLKLADGIPLPVTYTCGHASANNSVNGWTATAVAPSATCSPLYSNKSASQQIALSTLDVSGAYQAGSFLSSDLLYSDETSLNAGLNAASIVGLVFSPIDSQGDTTLLRRNDGKAFVKVGGDRVAVASPFILGTEDPSGEWQMLAPRYRRRQNQNLWRNNVAVNPGVLAGPIFEKWDCCCRLEGVLLPWCLGKCACPKDE